MHWEPALRGPLKVIHRAWALLSLDPKATALRRGLGNSLNERRNPSLGRWVANDDAFGVVDGVEAETQIQKGGNLRPLTKVAAGGRLELSTQENRGTAAAGAGRLLAALSRALERAPTTDAHERMQIWR